MARGAGRGGEDRSDDEKPSRAPEWALAYHTLARSLEAAAGQPPSSERLLAAAVGHALGGIVPNARHRAAGRLVDAARPSESAMEAILADMLSLDLNPFAQCMLRAPTREGALLAHRRFNEGAALSVRMSLGLNGDGTLAVLSRSRAADGEDPTSCRDMHLMGMGLIVSSIGEPEGRRRTRAAASVSAVAASLGLGSTAAAEAALAFESGSCVTSAEAAIHLGCHQRTLQRELKGAGLSAEAIKRACMLSRATSLLAGPATLTEVAHRCGYADHAHMTRAFAASCGLPPSALREALSPRP